MTDLPQQSDDPGGACVLRPEGKLDLANVGALHADLQGAGDCDIVVDLEQVTQLGALAMQTLIAAALDMTARGRTLRLVNTSDRVLGQIGAMGMTPEKIAGAAA